MELLESIAPLLVVYGFVVGNGAIALLRRINAYGHARRDARGKE